MKTEPLFKITIYTDTGGLREEIEGHYPLDEAFKIVFRDWIHNASSVNMGPYWQLQFDDNNIPNHYYFTPRSREMNDSEYAEFLERCKMNGIPRSNNELRPRVKMWEGVEGKYTFPKGRVTVAISNIER